MAQRYGGKYSPQREGETARGSYRGAVRTRAGGRVNLLFIAPLPLVWQAFSGGATGLVLNLAALGLLILAAWLTREGILAQEAFEARRVARRPAVPRKMLGSALTGLGLGLASFAAIGGIIEPVIYALLGAALHSAAFGFDPLKDKGLAGVDSLMSGRVARAVDQAEAYLKEMSAAARRAGDRQVEARVERFQRSVRDMMRTLEDDPRDLTAARRFLTVYLMGARDATEKFADIHARSPNSDARADYLQLLGDLDDGFAAKTRKLMEDNTTDLEIEISVLRDRLQREGVRLDRAE